MNNFEILKNKKLLTIFGIIIGVLIVLAFILSIITNNSNKGPSTTVAQQDTLQYPIANFSGKKSGDFLDNTSNTNYKASRLLVGDFLINNQKVKSEVNNAPDCEILSYSTEFGDNSTYLVNFEFKSLDNGKKYKAQIVNYMDNSKSSYIKIIDYNYEKTFSNNL